MASTYEQLNGGCLIFDHHSPSRDRQIKKLKTTFFRDFIRVNARTFVCFVFIPFYLFIVSDFRDSALVEATEGGVESEPNQIYRAFQQDVLLVCCLSCLLLDRNAVWNVTMCRLST